MPPFSGAGTESTTARSAPWETAPKPNPASAAPAKTITGPARWRAPRVRTAAGITAQLPRRAETSARILYVKYTVGAATAVSVKKTMPPAYSGPPGEMSRVKPGPREE